MIHDEFSSRTDVSRAAQYELRHQCDGICIYALPGRLRARWSHRMCEVVRLNACCSTGIGYSNPFEAFR